MFSWKILTALGGVIVIGGDGRFYNDVATQLVIQIAAANGIKKVHYYPPQSSSHSRF